MIHRVFFTGFEWARMKGGSALWTEDWMPDSASHRWSYYSARMRSAIALSNHSDEMIFSGYIVTRSSGQQEGGLLQRPLTMVGSGAKAVRYYNFGPECKKLLDNNSEWWT